MIFAYACRNERQECWLMAHQMAFEYFGGVAEVIVPDNASTASNAISAADRNRQVNSTYAQFLEHYNTAALPARVKRPKDKANVEAAVKIVTQKVIHFLDGHQCVDIDELNKVILARVDAINAATPFRRQAPSRRELFDTYERDLLGALPDTAWEATEWKSAKVAPDSHITINTVRYSVPHQYVGRRVDARITGQTLTVFVDGERIAAHRIDSRRGVYVTDPDHLPAHLDTAVGLWSTPYFVREAAKVGPATQAVIEEMIAAKPIAAQAYQSCRNVLNLGKHNKPVLEAACQRLVDTSANRRAATYTAVKNMMAAVRKDTESRPSSYTPDTSAPIPAAPLARDTRGAYLAGADQFTLSALTSKEHN
ncbi:Mu transposase domain-containing protein [Corynebacterium aquatimens]|uniref:Mu transposase domain-containing protein n=2 Tax=Corynebacterium TaxID=1716 RepID=UPI002541FE9E|nr:hypothetical protein [Corynebacterium aquatimens]